MPLAELGAVCAPAPMCIYFLWHTHQWCPMRTNIEIDDLLLSRAMAASGLTTKKATVEEGLRMLVRVRRQIKALASIKGLGWEGDLGDMRQGRR